MGKGYVQAVYGKTNDTYTYEKRSKKKRKTFNFTYN